MTPLERRARDLRHRLRNRIETERQRGESVDALYDWVQEQIAFTLAEMLKEAAQIAHAQKSEAELERHKTTDGEGKACWLWAFDTANVIERDILALETSHEQAEILS